ncbi:hypothetical protein ANCCAN_02517, partial [Ancylostoma caninum]
QPPPSSTSDVEKTCHRLAYYDKNKKQCACHKPRDDITKTKLFTVTESERALNPGVLCLDCDSDRTHDVFFVVDVSHHDKNQVRYLVRSFLFSMANYNARARLIAYGHSLADDVMRRDLKLGDDLIKVTRKFLKKYASARAEANLNAGLSSAYNAAKNIPNKKRMVIVYATRPATNPAAALTESNKIKQAGTPIHVFATPEGRDSNIDKYGSEEAFIVNNPTEKTSPDISKATTRLEQLFLRSTCLRD